MIRAINHFRGAGCFRGNLHGRAAHKLPRFMSC